MEGRFMFFLGGVGNVTSRILIFNFFYAKSLPRALAPRPGVCRHLPAVKVQDVGQLR